MVYSYGVQDEFKNEHKEVRDDLDLGEEGPQKGGSEEAQAKEEVGDEKIENGLGSNQATALSENSDDSKIDADLVDSNSIQNTDANVSNIKHRKKSPKTFTTKRKKLTSEEQKTPP